MDELKKLENQNFHQYVWAMDELVQLGKYKNWKEITPFVNKELFGDDESQYRDESSYRKPCKYARDYYEAGVFGNGEDEYLKKLQDKKRELQKEKQKLSDERIEFNRQIRQEARKESYVDMVKRIICEDVSPINLPVHYTLFNTDTDLLVHFTDVHTGIEINNWKNTFNEDVLEQRVKKYTSDILDIRKLHQSQDCYLVIGEILSGLIHSNLRLQNNMDLMEQFKYISELVSAMLVRLASDFNHIYVYTTAGNHSRLVAKKEDSLDGENFDVLLPFYLKARLQNIENISICENTIEPEIAMFNIRGNHIFSSHGHKDKPANVVQNFTMMFGIKPDIVLLGHRHTNGLTTVYDTKVIESGCVSGSDAYAVSIRKTNKPEQTVSVIGDNGLICLYDIQLD
jgi:predicted phosphodiesterase